MSKLVECPECHGSGACLRCGGSGGGDSAEALCRACRGSGDCPRCDGEGRIEQDPGPPLSASP
jgi:hypothetical protein